MLTLLLPVTSSSVSLSRKDVSSTAEGVTVYSQLRIKSDESIVNPERSRLTDSEPLPSVIGLAPCDKETYKFVSTPVKFSDKARLMSNEPLPIVAEIISELLIEIVSVPLSVTGSKSIPLAADKVEDAFTVGVSDTEI